MRWAANKDQISWSNLHTKTKSERDDFDLLSITDSLIKVNLEEPCGSIIAVHTLAEEVDKTLSLFQKRREVSGILFYRFEWIY